MRRFIAVQMIICCTRRKILIKNHAISTDLHDRWTSYKENEGDVLNKVDATQSKRKLVKVIYYFSLISRLKKIYASLKTASSMR